MSRYIDADKLLSDELTHRLPAGFGELSGKRYVFVEDIENAPTADVVEVRYGEWETVCNATTTSGFNWYMHICSTCGYSYKNTIGMGYTYCPRCGANMDRVRKEK